MAKKPTPGMLGTGMAAKASKAMKSRKSRMDEEIERQSGGGSKKRK